MRTTSSRRSGHSRGRAGRRWRATCSIIRHRSRGDACSTSPPVAGIAAIAAAIAGAGHVEAAEIDALAAAAITLNAAANGATLHVLVEDVVGQPCRWDLILCGDVCYEAPMTRHILPWLRRMAEQAEVWIADPGRAYLPREGLAPFATYAVPTTTELEDRTERVVTIARLAPIPAPAPRR